MNRRSVLKSAIAAVCGLLGWKSEASGVAGDSERHLPGVFCDVCGEPATHAARDIHEIEPCWRTRSKQFVASAVHGGCDRHEAKSTEYPLTHRNSHKCCGCGSSAYAVVMDMEATGAIGPSGIAPSYANAFRKYCESCFALTDPNGGSMGNGRIMGRQVIQYLEECEA